MTSKTTRLDLTGERPRRFRRRVRIEVTGGPCIGRTVTSSKRRISVGSAAENDLVLDDSAVSRHHLAIDLTEQEIALTDLGSTNGVFGGGLRLRQATIDGPITLTLGRTTLLVAPLAEEDQVPIALGSRFGRAIGESPVMRELFEQLARVSPTDATVLLQGPTGCGKEVLAEEIHRHSQRRDGPFVVVDCGALPATLIESELFGHIEGAFTGATQSKSGAFEAASSGTVFLDEIGELDISLQPQLLRVLETRQVRPVGSNRYRDLDFRVVAATHRDLLRDVNQGSFRADLYYRLAIVPIYLPPLAERPEDIEPLLRLFLEAICRQYDLPAPPISAAMMEEIRRHPWPGNARQLRNFTERLAILSRSGSGTALPEPTAGTPTDHLFRLAALPFAEAKQQWTELFDVEYVRRALQRHRTVVNTAKHTGIHRSHLFRLMKKYGLTAHDH